MNEGRSRDTDSSTNGARDTAGRTRAPRGRGKATSGTRATAGERARPTIQPDDLDRQIIALLREDGRRSNREVARKLGVPEATVRYRVRRLTDSGILSRGVGQPEHLGYALTAVISVQVEPRLFVSASNVISAMPEVMWLAITAGASDIIFTASFHNQEEMFTFVADRLAHVDGIDRIHTSVCMRVVKKSHQWSTDLTSAMAADLDSDEDLLESIPAPQPATARRKRAATTAG